MESDECCSDEQQPLSGRPPSRRSRSRSWLWLAAGAVLGMLGMCLMPSGWYSTLYPMRWLGAHGIGALGADQSSCGAVPMPPPPMVRRNSRSSASDAINVLVTGGGGFIGSHFALALFDRKGYNVTVVDDLSRGSIETIIRLKALAKAAGQPFAFENLDVNDGYRLESVLLRRNIQVVVHFSGNAYVGESMVKPEEYFQNITVTPQAPSHAARPLA